MINIRYVEYDTRHPGDFRFDIPSGHDCWLLLLIRTPALFLVESEMREYPANCAVFFRPHHPIYYCAAADHFSDDWIRFDTDEAYVITAPIPSGVPFPAKDPEGCHMLYQLLCAEDASTSEYRKLNTDNLLRTLFNKLFESYDTQHDSPLTNKIVHLRTEIYLFPALEWTLSGIAKQLNVSTGYLSAQYRKCFGVSCIEDVMNARISSAKKHLLYGNESISDIATICGYRNVEHFFRQFRTLTGFTPNIFRKQRGSLVK